MTRNRLWAGAALLAALGGVAALALADRSDAPIAAPVPAERPALALLTSLPLLFGESFGLEGGGSAVLSTLEQRYNVVPIGVADRTSLSGQRLLLMAHPRAQPAQALVELDQWVRSGGRVLLLADPKLDWPSERPIGDRLRPPPAFADTGLLGHWGLTLVAPGTRGPVPLGGGHNPIIYYSPGRLVSTNPSCMLSRADIIAECRVGKGRIAVVADADFLNADAMESYGGFARNQLSELMELLETLQTR